MKIDGACHCGNITYEAEIDPENVVICHCTDCQTLSGSAFRTVALSLEGSFTLRSGEPKVYVKTAESGAKRQQGFCAECGTPIFATSEGGGPKIHGIRVGTIRQRNELIPKRQVWTRSQLHWLGELDSMQKIEQQSQLGLNPAATD
jgi:hypothetical protein